jgi:hypothetical protein
MDINISKKKVGIIYSGQMRSNSLSNSYNEDYIILDSINKNFLNTQFKNKYNYDIFFSVDDINIEKSKNFFKDNLKNIHITEKNWFMNNIKNQLIPYEYFYDKYLQINFEGCENHINSLYQYYRLYCGYELLKDYEQKNNIKYDYYIRIRPDIRVMQDINFLLDILENDIKEIIFEHEQLCIFTNKYEDIFNFIYYYGFFKNPVDKFNNIFNLFIKDFNGMVDDKISRYCPERQIIEYVNMLIKNNNKNFKKIFLGITYPSFCLLYRGSNNYAYISSYEEYLQKYPYHNKDYIINKLI